MAFPDATGARNLHRGARSRQPPGRPAWNVVGHSGRMRQPFVPAKARDPGSGPESSTYAALRCPACAGMSAEHDRSPVRSSQTRGCRHRPRRGLGLGGPAPGAPCRTSPPARRAGHAPARAASLPARAASPPWPVRRAKARPRARDVGPAASASFVAAACSIAAARCVSSRAALAITRVRVRAVRRLARAVARCNSEAARASAEAASSRATPAKAAATRRVAGALSGGGRGPARRTPTSVPGRQVLALRGRQPSARTSICTARSVRPASRRDLAQRQARALVERDQQRVVARPQRAIALRRERG